MSRKISKSKVEDLLFRIAQCYAYTEDAILYDLAEEAYQRGEMWLLSVESRIDSKKSYDLFIQSYLNLLDYDEQN